MKTTPEAIAQIAQKLPEEPTLRDLLRHITHAKFYILIGAATGLLAALLFITLAKPYYQATMIISPANPMNNNQLSSLLANGNLFAIRHLIQSNSNNAEFQSFEQIIHGQSTAKALLTNPTIQKGIKLDQKYSPFGLSLFGNNKEGLTTATLSEYLTKHVKIHPVSNTAFRRIEYKHPSAEFSAYLLTQLHLIADKSLRAKTNANAETRIAYLKAAIRNTKNPEHRRALTTLLMEQERLRMLSSIDQPYAASIIEPAAASAKPKWPQKSLLFALLISCGAFIGFIAYSLRD